MSLCLGIDLSTKRVDLAAIPLDPDIDRPPLWLSVDRTETYADLYRGIRDSLFDFSWDGHDIATVAVEKPAGKFVHPKLHELHGAILASIPQYIASTSLYPVEWRQALGLVGKAKNNKAAGNARVLELYPMCESWDEHQLDALGIARAWRDIQWRATEGAA